MYSLKKKNAKCSFTLDARVRVLPNINYINVLVFAIEGGPEIRMLEYDDKEISYTLDASKTSLDFIKNYSRNKFVKQRIVPQIYYDLYQADQFITTLLSYRN